MNLRTQGLPDMRRCGFDLLRVRDKLPLNTHRGQRLISNQ